MSQRAPRQPAQEAWHGHWRCSSKQDSPCSVRSLVLGNISQSILRIASFIKGVTKGNKEGRDGFYISAKLSRLTCYLIKATVYYALIPCSNAVRYRCAGFYALLQIRDKASNSAWQTVSTGSVNDWFCCLGVTDPSHPLCRHCYCHYLTDEETQGQRS